MGTFKDIIFLLRNEKGFSQEQLSKELNVSKSTIAMWEIGSRMPSPEKFEEIADYFNVDIDYLYGRSEIPKKAENFDLFKELAINNRIVDYRKVLGLSRKEMSDKTGIPYSTYSNYENGNHIPSIEELQKILNVLGVSIHELLIFSFVENIEDIHKISEILDNISISTTPKTEKIIAYIPDNKCKHLINNYTKLNNSGRDEAIKRVAELTELKKYTELKQEFTLKAARERTDIEVTDAMKKHDNDIMNAEDF